jgi:uncharacterized protein
MRQHGYAGGLKARIFAVLCMTALLGATPAGSPVADAAMKGDTGTVRALLRDGADVNAAQGDGMTALHWAAQRGDVEMAKILVYAGANVKATTRLGGYTPLLLASREGDAPMLAALLDAGADPDAATTTGTTALHFAAASGISGAVTTLLDHGAKIDARENAAGQTPLMFAAAYDRADVIRTLLARGADAKIESSVVDAKKPSEQDAADRRRRNAIIAAAKPQADKPAGGRGEAADPKEELQGRQGAQGGQRAGARGEQRTEASQSGKDTARAATANGQEANSRAGGGRARSTADQSADELQGDEEDGQKRGGSNTPQPLSYNDLVGGWGGMTALLHAARQGNTSAVKALIEGGADVNEVSGGDHTSPLLIATINGHFDLAMYLLEQGADPNLASNAGAAPLYAALNVQWAPHAFYPQPSPAQQKTTHNALLKALLDHGADPDRRLDMKVWYTGYNFDQSGVDETGATAFWRAAQASDVEAMRLLAGHGAHPDIWSKVLPERRAPNGRNSGQDLDKAPPVPVGGPAVSPLHVATGAGYDGNFHRNSPAGWLPAVKYLVEELGFDVNEPDYKGYTPLHNAAFRGDNEMIEYLVSKGADPLAVARNGQTTVDMANGPIQRLQPFPETIALLESLGAKNNHKCVSC